jgi:hypothetical protein
MGLARRWRKEPETGPEKRFHNDLGHLSQLNTRAAKPSNKPAIHPVLER